MGKRLALWLTEEEEKEVKKLRRLAEKDRRSLNSYCKKILFNFGGGGRKNDKEKV